MQSNSLCFFFSVGTIFPQSCHKFTKTVKTPWWQKNLVDASNSSRSLLLLFSVHLFFLILTPLVMVLGHQWSRSEVHCYCRRSSKCCQLYCHSPALIPVTSSTPHPPLHHIMCLSNFAQGRLFLRKKSLSRGANLNKLNEKLVGAKGVAKLSGRT